MANVFQASTGYRDPLKAMTLKALEARAKAAAEASMASTQIQQPISDPWQGASHLMNVLGSGIDQIRADRSAAAGRDRLAQLQAGIKDYGNIDPQVLAQVGALDPEQQRFLQERMLSIQNREDTQQFQAGESQLERDQRQALQNQQDALTRSENALQRGSTEGIAAAGNVSEEGIASANRAATTATADANRAATTATADLDRASREKVNQADINAQVTQLQDQIAAIDRDTRLTPEEKEAAKNKLTAAGGMVLSTTTDAEGNTTTTYDTTGKGAGAGQKVKNEANALETYRQTAQSGNDVLQTVDIMRKAGKAAGYTGPGGSAVGYADDFLEAVSGLVGQDWSLPGASGARALVKRGALTFLQDAIAKTKGAISEAENRLFLQTAPTLDQTPEGREFMLTYAEKLAQRSVERASEAAKWMADNGNLDGFEEQWNNYITNEPIIFFDEQAGKLSFVE